MPQNSNLSWIFNSSRGVWVYRPLYLVIDVDPVRIFAGTELQTVVQANRVIRLLLSVIFISYQREGGRHDGKVGMTNRRRKKREEGNERTRRADDHYAPYRPLIKVRLSAAEMSALTMLTNTIFSRYGVTWNDPAVLRNRICPDFVPQSRSTFIWVRLAVKAPHEA